MTTASELEARHAVAAALDAARAERRAIPPPPALATLTTDEAYLIQDAVIALREATGARVAGWKLGLTGSAKRASMGIATPVYGRIFADGQVPNGGARPHAAFIAPNVEPELAFCLAQPIDSSMDRAALLAALAWVAPALEITDGRYLPGKRTAVELIADDTAASSYVLGVPVAVAHAPPLHQIETRIARNGRLVSHGTTADVLGDPVQALALLAAHLEQRGLRAAAGTIVLSGSITDSFAVAPGDWVETTLGGLGDVTVLFT